MTRKDREWLLGQQEASKSLKEGIFSIICVILSFVMLFTGEGLLILLSVFVTAPLGLLLGIFGLRNAFKAKKHGFPGGSGTSGAILSSISVLIIAIIVIFIIIEG